jgi:hypothetical protein
MTRCNSRYYEAMMEMEEFIKSRGISSELQEQVMRATSYVYIIYYILYIMYYI